MHKDFVTFIHISIQSSWYSNNVNNNIVSMINDCIFHRQTEVAID